ncbi:Alpha/Beta hydrolase protein [Lipomyces tetrasporus]
MPAPYTMHRIQSTRTYSVLRNRPTSPTSRLSLIPGTMCDNRLWNRMLPVFGKANILVDQVPIHQAANKNSMREMIASSVRGENLQDQKLPVDLLGFSMGGYLALDYYFRTLVSDGHNLNHQVRSLVIVCSSAKGLGEKERIRRIQMLDLMSKHAYAGISPSRIAKFVSPGLVDDPEVGGLMAAMDKDLGKDVLLTQFSTTLDRENFMLGLKEIRAPVLIVGAEADQMVRTTDIYCMHERIKDSKLVMFEDVGHMVPLEAPERLATTVLDFMSGL